MDSTLAAGIILGTYDHDRFKPFWLGQPKHALLGYVHARAVRKQSEVYCLAILLHAADSKHFSLPKLMAWHTSGWPQTTRRLPRALLAANWIDRIASSSYSMFGEDEQGHGLYGQYEAWGSSAQNPFSRLPVYDSTLIGGRVARAEADATAYAAQFFGGRLPDQALAERWGELESQTRQRIRDGVPVAPPPAPPPPPSPVPASTAGGGLAHKLGAGLRKLLGSGAAHPQPPAPAPPAVEGPPPLDPYHELAAALQAMPAEQAKVLLQAYAVFAERSYPHPNDTALQLHTKLAANLYYVLLANLSDASPLAGAGLEGLDAAAVAPWYAPTASAAGQQSLHTVLDLLQSSIVSVRLAGIEERFASAVRLDDLQGAKLLADRVRRALKGRICRDLGFGLEATTSADETALSDLLCLSESRFTLTYLLPRSYVEREGGLLDRLHALYDESLADVVTSAASVPPASKSALPLLDYLTLDIQRALDDAPKGGEVQLRPTAEGLLAGLRTMPPAFGVAGVQVNTAQAQREEDFGAALVKAYAQAQDAANSSMAPRLWDIVAGLGADEGSAAICSVTQAAPVWKELSDYAYGRTQPRIEQLQQYFHTFRDEPEELSQAGVAMRALAQGLAQTEALDKLITGQYDAGTGMAKLLYAEHVQGQPPTPPLLQRRATIQRGDGLVDLNAVHVRIRRDAAHQPDPLVRFPSVTYAADRNGNVALLTLRPTRAIYQAHQIPFEFMTLVGDQPGSYGGLRAAADLHDLYLNPRPERRDNDRLAQLRAELQCVPAHLARVLGRQQAISTFFRRLPQRLQAAGIRVLALEDEHPVGRYLLPAEALGAALNVLDRALMLDLLSVNGADLGLDDDMAMRNPDACNVLDSAGGREAGERRARLRSFLAAYVQDVLVGSAIIFKHKQALYLMLRAEERLQGRIARQPVMSMALSDMRGTLVDRSPLHAQYAFADWGEIQAVTEGVDRRSISGLAYDWDQYDQFAGAPVEEPVEHEKQRAALEQLVRARWTNRLYAADVRKQARAEWVTLADRDQREVINAALLLIRAARASGHKGAASIGGEERS